MEENPLIAFTNAAQFAALRVPFGTDHSLFCGGPPDATMPDIEDNPLTLAPGRRTAVGVRKIRENYRDVARKHFQGPLTIPQLVSLLFPNLNSQEL